MSSFIDGIFEESASIFADGVLIAGELPGIFINGVQVSFDMVMFSAGMADIDARNLMEGQQLTFRLIPRLNALDDTVFPPVLLWSTLNLTSATAALQYYNGTSWVNMVSGTTYDEVTTSELTLITTALLTQGVFRVMLSRNAITSNKIDKFSVSVSLTQ